jgi:hypothetical protein
MGLNSFSQTSPIFRLKPKTPICYPLTEVNGNDKMSFANLAATENLLTPTRTSPGEETAHGLRFVCRLIFRQA